MKCARCGRGMPADKAKCQSCGGLPRADGDGLVERLLSPPVLAAGAVALASLLWLALRRSAPPPEPEPPPVAAAPEPAPPAEEPLETPPPPPPEPAAEAPAPASAPAAVPTSGGRPVTELRPGGQRPDGTWEGGSLAPAPSSNPH